MKTNISINNIGKITLFFLAALLLSTGSLLAQNNSIKESENIDDDVAYTASTKHLSQDLYTGVSEKPTEIEAWMSSTNFWKNIELQLELNSTLDIEPWMSSTDFWNELKTNSEKPIQIENWMMDTNLWKSKEGTLEIEAWMTDSNYWESSSECEKGLLLENWMSDANFWAELNNEEVAKIENWMTDKNYWTN